MMLANGCAPTLSSTTAKPGIAVDGQALEWEGVELTLLGESGLTMALQHDQHRLFIYLASGESRVLEHLSKTGLTLWVDETHDEAKMAGVRFEPALNLLDTEAVTRELHLDRVGLWPPSKAVPNAHQGGKSGLWVAEVEFPLDASGDGDLRLAIEVVKPPKVLRPGKTTVVVAPARRPALAPRKALRQPVPMASTKKTSSKPKTERTWFVVKRLAR